MRKQRKKLPPNLKGDCQNSHARLPYRTPPWQIKFHDCYTSITKHQVVGQIYSISTFPMKSHLCQILKLSCEIWNLFSSLFLCRHAISPGEDEKYVFPFVPSPFLDFWFMTEARKSCAFLKHSNSCGLFHFINNI